ncbi:putative alpha-fucosidase A [Leucoagaricus sp. SymC.cos]|nr:putative alpha-fucosidase A [Leucoagaricus sp. SymC.cos]
MTPGGTTQETLQLNIESLWSGGPFADPNYNGGNKQPSERDAMASALKDIRQKVLQSPIGEIDNIDVLTSDMGQFGSYAGAGYLISNIDATGPVANYSRFLDLDQAIVGTVWTQNGATYQRTLFCSNPSQSCTQYINITSSTSSAIHTLPKLSYVFSSALQEGLPTPNVTCLGQNILQIRGFVGAPSMLYEILARATAPGGVVRCTQIPVSSGSPANATLDVVGNAKEAWLTWVGDTNYDLNAGTPASNFSYRGPDPHDKLVSLLAKPASTAVSFSSALEEHIEDYKAVITTPFSLDLGQSAQLDTPTDTLISQYRVDGMGNAAGNVFIDWLAFNLGRYLLFSSYALDINIQMNYWMAEITNLDVTAALFEFIQKGWVPRGTYTAEVLYNTTQGWIMHNAIFGQSGMMAGDPGSAEWADYAVSNAWMMSHVWDHFDYTNDLPWWRSTGWPLLKGVALFHLNNIVEDLHFKDTTLVAAPCNSPEQLPITFAVEKGFTASGDTDTDFLKNVRTARAKIDKGIHIGSWGQLQEWKVEKDSPSDTHRHLSHLVGLFPGFAIASYDPAVQGPTSVNGSSVTYTRGQVLDAAKTSLIHRGNGTGPDADSGWEKAWRAGAYAQLGDSEAFYHLLSYCIERNFAANLFSIYDPFDPNPVFQIDANLAYPAAVMNALLQAPDVPTTDSPLKITLLPALPSQWPQGSFRGARVRGGVTVDLAWKNGKPTNASFRVDTHAPQRKLEIWFAGKVLATLTSTPGLRKAITSF